MGVTNLKRRKITQYEVGADIITKQDLNYVNVNVFN